jgi:hypothetical protein
VDQFYDSLVLFFKNFEEENPKFDLSNTNYLQNLIMSFNSTNELNHYEKNSFIFKINPENSPIFNSKSTNDLIENLIELNESLIGRNNEYTNSQIYLLIRGLVENLRKFSGKDSKLPIEILISIYLLLKQHPELMNYTIEDND